MRDSPKRYISKTDPILGDTTHIKHRSTRYIFRFPAKTRNLYLNCLLLICFVSRMAVLGPFRMFFVSHVYVFDIIWGPGWAPKLAQTGRPEFAKSAVQIRLRVFVSKHCRLALPDAGRWRGPARPTASTNTRAAGFASAQAGSARRLRKQLRHRTADVRLQLEAVAMREECLAKCTGGCGRGPQPSQLRPRLEDNISSARRPACCAHRGMQKHNSGNMAARTNCIGSPLEVKPAIANFERGVAHHLRSPI